MQAITQIMSATSVEQLEKVLTNTILSLRKHLTLDLWKEFCAMLDIQVSTGDVIEWNTKVDLSLKQRYRMALQEILQKRAKAQSAPQSLESIRQEISAKNETYQTFRNWILNSENIYRADLEILLWPTFFWFYLRFLEMPAINAAREFIAKYGPDHEEKYQQEVRILRSLLVLDDYFKEYSGPFPGVPNKAQYLLPIIRGQVNALMSISAYECLSAFVNENRLREISEMIVSKKINIKRKEALLFFAQNLIDERALSDSTEQYSAQFLEAPDIALTPLSFFKKAKLETPRVLTDPLPWRLPEKTALFLRDEYKLRHELPTSCSFKFLGNAHDVTAMGISRDCRYFAVGLEDSSIRLSDFKSAPKLGIDPENPYFTKIKGHSGPVSDIIFDCTSEKMFSASQDGTVKIWDLEKNQSLRGTCSEHTSPIWAIDVLNSGNLFATAGHDRTCRVFQTSRPEESERIFLSHFGEVTCVKFHPQGQYILTGSEDKTMRAWDLRAGPMIRLFSVDAPITSIAISPDGRLASCGTDFGKITTWDLRYPSIRSYIPVLSVKQGSLKQSSANPSSESGQQQQPPVYNKDLEMQQKNSNQNENLTTCSRPSSNLCRVWSLDFSHDSQYLASCSEAGACFFAFKTSKAYPTELTGRGFRAQFSWRDLLTVGELLEKN